MKLKKTADQNGLPKCSKVTYEAMHLFTICVEKALPHLSKEETQGFMLDFFTYLYGIDCFIQVRSKQQEALKFGNIPYHPVSIHDADRHNSDHNRTGRSQQSDQQCHL